VSAADYELGRADERLVAKAKADADFEKGYDQGVDEVLSEVKAHDLGLYRLLCSIFNPARR
jgi:hypothetical protein